MATAHHGDRWFAYHHASQNEHAEHWRERTEVGWHCISLARANTAADPCFAAVWIWPENRLPKQSQAHVGWDKIHDYLDPPPSGTFPTLIAASASGLESPMFTVVYEEGSRAHLAKAALTHDELLAQCITSRSNGKVLRWAAAYPRLNEMRYAAIWVGDPTRVAWKCTGAMEANDFQAEFDANELQRVRPSVIIPTLASPYIPSSRRHMAAWCDGLVRMSLCYADIDDATLASLIQKHKAEGRLPIHIQSIGAGRDMRYALIIGSPDDVIDRGTFVFDGHPPAVPTPATRYLGTRRVFRRHPDNYSASSGMSSVLDAAVKQDMENTGRRATTLAVAYRGDLVFAAGYTFAEQDLYPLTTPTDVFRVGSLSKVITAIAAHQLHETKPLLDEKVAALLGLRFKDADGQNIRVKHLGAHLGGLPKNAGSSFAGDAMEYDDEAAAAVNNGKLPVDKDMVFAFLCNLAGFVSTPGAAYKYSNTGYELLGEVVRKRSGGTLKDHVDREIFKRAGIRLDAGAKAPRWAESERLPNQNGEAWYHDPRLFTTKTVASSSGKRVPVTYGGWNMERIRGSAAWVISAPHYLRMLSRFTVPGPNPLFKQPATETTFTQRATLNDGSGSSDTWGGLRLSNGGKTFAKTGAAPGARATSLFRSDGWSMVYLTNGDDGVDADDAVSTAGVEAWLDLSWKTVSADPAAWSRVYVTP